MRKPHPNAIAYEVTAKRPGLGGRPFRRVGRDFPLGRLLRVEADSLTPGQREFLLNSDPRDLVVVEIVADPPRVEGVEVAAPADETPEAALVEGSPADENPSSSEEGEDDDEPGDDTPVEGTDSATSAPSSAPRRKKGKRR